MRRLALLLLLLPAAADDTVAIERDTEALAHRLIDLARALRTGAPAPPVFAPDAGARGFPPRPGAAERLPLGLVRRTWTPGAGAPGAFEALQALAGPAVSLQPAASRRESGRLVAAVKMNVVRGRVWRKAMLEVVADPRIVSVRLVSMETIDAAGPIFTDVTADAGIARADPPVLEHPTLGLAAYGAAAGDVDRDGRIDLLVTAHDATHLLLNRGDGGFREVAVPTPRAGTAPLLLDFDNDGDLDAFFSADGAQMLLENRLVPDGRLSFRDVSEAMGVAAESIGFGVAAADVNGDRRPDLYVTAYNRYGPVAPESWVDGGNGLPNLFFVSRPDGTYAEEAERWGVADARWSYAAQFCDIDGDGKQDLYVANDFGAGNGCFMRRGDRFVDEAKERGVRDDGYGMGVSFSDYDNDGRLDLHVTRMSSTAGARILARLDRPDLPLLRRLSSGNGLFRNLGAGRFADTAAAAGPFAAGWAWGGGFLDIDNDGFEDLYTPNGHLSGAEEKDT